MALELIARKIKMGNIFRDDGTRLAVTFVELLPLRVTQVKRADGPDGYSALQVGYDPVEGHRLSRAEVGHQDQISGKPMRYLTEMKVDDPSQYSVNQKLDWDLVKEGDRVDVVGVSKGRGFAGGMKRHGFHGQSSSHGTSKTHRKPMSSGATDAARVFKGTKKPGHMGAERVTVGNLEVVMMDGDSGIVAISGAVPGPSGGLLRIIPRETGQSG